MGTAVQFTRSNTGTTGTATWTVPAGVSSVQVTCSGARGGGVGWGTGEELTEVGGGLGGRVSGALAVTPGDVLHVYVGAQGAGGTEVFSGSTRPAGGHSGGSPGGAGGTGGYGVETFYGAGGGGSSEVRRNDTSLGARVAVAGGGGGAAVTGDTLATRRGVSGGQSGDHGYAGHAGRFDGPGAGGQTFVGWAGTEAAAGTLTTGGAGAGGAAKAGAHGGGGGGGGAYPGGGGGVTAGGGAGANLTSGLTAVVDEYGVNYGDGSVLLAYNRAPNAPTRVGPGGTINRAQPQRFSWQHSDPDGDPQSAFTLRYRPVGAAAWTTVQVSSPAQSHDLAGGTLAAGDYEWQVRTADTDLTGPYSTSGFFTAADVPGVPTITDPVNGGTIPTDTYLLRWSATEQRAYRVRKVADAAGAPDTATVLYDSGAITSTAREHLLTFPENDRAEHLQVQVDRNGLWSDWGTVAVQVSYTPPAVPGVTVTPVSTRGLRPDSLQVAVTHPAPSGTQPQVMSVDVFRRLAGDGDGERLAAGLAAGSSWTDHGPGSGTPYEYEVVAHGANGTSSRSGWVG